MDLEKMKRKYAYTLARVGLNVQKGQTVLVEAAVEGWQFTSIFAEECYKLGAGNVVVHYLDLPNLVETWENVRAQKAARGKAVDDLHLTKLHYTASNGTDLTVGLTPWSKFGHGDRKPAIPFVPNIPTEEICTTPNKFETNGVVYASRPLVLGGKKIENFGFRFENGKVVEVLADEGKEMLEALIATDENAGYLGEAALVEYHSPISMSGLVYYTTLIDENASCHLALGRGLNSAAPEDKQNLFNDSTIHVDFMVGTPDMKIVGTTESGEEVEIFRDGDFAI